MSMAADELKTGPLGRALASHWLEGLAGKTMNRSSLITTDLESKKVHVKRNPAIPEISKTSGAASS